MRAIAVDFERRSTREIEHPAPRIESGGEVLFRIHQLGVCATDRAVARFDIVEPPPGESHIVLGHEALGQVEETGAAVADFKRGDWVVPQVRRACSPPCVCCASGRRDLCVSGNYRERGIMRMHGYWTEYAVDDARDLVAIPESMLDIAVLVEPLTSVEKAIATALRLHERAAPPQTALVIGAGPIGILCALALQLRGIEPRVFSQEDEDHPRARLLRRAGIGYSRTLGGTADLIFEAAGAERITEQAIRCLARLGVYAVIGVTDVPVSLRMRQLILGNQIVFGTVNASPESFRAAVRDLEAMDRRILESMIERVAFGDFEKTLLGPTSAAPKLVHVA